MPPLITHARTPAWRRQTIPLPGRPSPASWRSSQACWPSPAAPPPPGPCRPPATTSRLEQRLDLDLRRPFRYLADGTDVTINETVTYTVAARETFQGQDAYKLNITGTITSGSGTVAVDGVGNATLKNFSGTVTGTRYVRVSDLALLQENQHQHMTATARSAIISHDIVADINLQLTPRDPSWKVHNFPLNAGDSWHTNTDIDYDGGFTYDAGSLGGTGTSPFGPDTMVVRRPVHRHQRDRHRPDRHTCTAKKVTAVNADNTHVRPQLVVAAHKNQVKEILVLPLDGGSITLTRNMRAASIAGAAPQFSATTTPSLTCAGGNVTVTGNLSTGAAGRPGHGPARPVARSTPGQDVTATDHHRHQRRLQPPTLTVPGVQRRPRPRTARAPTGASPSRPASAAVGATTVVVTPRTARTLTYTGATSGPLTGSATVSAQLTDLHRRRRRPAARSPSRLGGGGSVNAVTNAVRCRHRDAADERPGPRTPPSPPRTPAAPVWPRPATPTAVRGPGEPDQHHGACPSRAPSPSVTTSPSPPTVTPAVGSHPGRRGAVPGRRRRLRCGGRRSRAARHQRR